MVVRVFDEEYPSAQTLTKIVWPELRTFKPIVSMSKLNIIARASSTRIDCRTSIPVD